MESMKLNGRTALVTGASGGLGEAFARELAARGAHLVLVARRARALEALAREIEAQHGVSATPLALDLGAAQAPARLHDQVTAAGQRVDVLVNNAGFGVFGSALSIPWERESAMLQLDIVAVVHLTRLFARDMVARGDGAILQLASTGAFQPTPGYASYSAAKAFVLSYSYALAYELRDSGVSCTVLSPGVTATGFLEVAGQKPTWFHRLTMLDAPRVARQGIDAMVARRAGRVTGWINRIAVHGARLNPTWLQTAIAHRAMRN